MTGSLRRCWPPREPPVTRARAIGLARQAAARHGLIWIDPVGVTQRRGTWVIWSGADRRGGNLRAVVDMRDGEVVRISGLPARPAEQQGTRIRLWPSGRLKLF